MSNSQVLQNEIREHDQQASAKRVVTYGWNGSSAQKQPTPFLTLPYDTAVITYTDSSKTTISTVVTKLNGVTQETLTLTSGSTTDTWARS